MKNCKCDIISDLQIFHEPLSTQKITMRTFVDHDAPRDRKKKNCLNPSRRSMLDAQAGSRHCRRLQLGYPGFEMSQRNFGLSNNFKALIFRGNSEGIVFMMERNPIVPSPYNSRW
jgi:hypothetical protein